MDWNKCHKCILHMPLVIVLAASACANKVAIQLHIISLLSLNQLLLYKDSSLTFVENYALRKGGGIYIEYVTTNLLVLAVLNRGCFIQYHSSSDNPPNTWVNILMLFVYASIVTVLFIFRMLVLVS